jgi:hypothetical protein
MRHALIAMTLIGAACGPPAWSAPPTSAPALLADAPAEPTTAPTQATAQPTAALATPTTSTTSAAVKPTDAPATAAVAPTPAAQATDVQIAAFKRPDVAPLPAAGRFQVVSQTTWPGDKVRMFFLGAQF